MIVTGEGPVAPLHVEKIGQAYKTSLLCDASSMLLRAMPSVPIEDSAPPWRALQTQVEAKKAELLAQPSWTQRWQCTWPSMT